MVLLLQVDAGFGSLISFFIASFVVVSVLLLTFTSELKNKLSAKCWGKDETEFTWAVKEICEEYDDKGIDKEDFMPDIDDGKSRSCIDERLKDSAEKVQFTKNDKIQEATDDSEEMLKMQKDTSNQMHYETFSKKHDIKREVHR